MNNSSFKERGFALIFNMDNKAEYNSAFFKPFAKITWIIVSTISIFIIINIILVKIGQTYTLLCQKGKIVN